MKIIDILNAKEVTLSFEVFPPKTSTNYETVMESAKKIAALKPAYMSVTYGAGGGTSDYTTSIAAELTHTYGVQTLAHLTCVSSTREKVASVIADMKEKRIENVLALRGDRPQDGTYESDYSYACELIEDIKTQGNFCIGGACYPEGHTESENKKADIAALKHKVDAGCEYLTTQMFFDNNILYNFLYRIREQSITVPVIAGIMPVTNANQVKRIVSMSGTQMPERFRAIVDRFAHDPAAMQQAGIIYATEQIIDLIANGVGHIHVYSMNKPEVAAGIQASLSEILK